MKKNKKRYGKKIIIILLIISLLAVLLSFLLSYFSVLEVKTIKAEINISNFGGFNVDPSYLNFGVASPGGSSSRTLSLVNNDQIPVVVNIVAQGEIKGFIPSQQVFLNAGETKEISISAFIPPKIQFGVYRGKVLFITKRA